ncbi:MAG: TIGR04211 family SH3 domain-containing protein [Gammaproteobacteria bacterium]|nr:TIGR04211 family SH3 domain-containing protein [Gammaproteobacteria bacterium]MBT4147338.1 TIGR04211 family SH3 domain-containing protein [Gammaproteobacteria bacterium]MBT5222966.1 TIGR04211 family SH3 domain-containing protein [Gammaproteobacteria bacterium]MBT5825333.1 TIGR04211 family SH3 domain-containing protein [Gammaproteobacteria bacterium]MBT5967470.1 TIGR04211 family SH3 domain-containing protein [Gammaproteobacteria bacterium]
MKFTLRSGESNSHKIVKMLPSGSKLTLLDTNKTTKYSKVKTAAGVVGYLPSRFTQEKPISSWYLKKANEKLGLLQSENEQIKLSLAELQKNNSSSTSSNTNLTKERDQLSTELNDLRQTASNAIQLKRQRNELQERVVNVERELQQLKREKQALEDSTSQDWFLYGGILSFLGIFFGLLIPKISWQRKSHGNWDTF